MYAIVRQRQAGWIGIFCRFALASLCLALPAGAATIDDCRAAIADKHRLTAYETCLPLAQVGDPDAAFLVAGLYAMGVDLQGQQAAPDLKTAVKWLRIAAENGHAEAMYNLGIAYHHGKGAKKDLQEAIRIYRKAAELGNGKAMRNLATLYETGQGVEQDLGSAFTLYEQSAQTGLPDSQLKTALMLLSGEGVVADPIKARFWLNLSAANHNPTAQLTLGVILAETEPATSIYWYRKAARQNNPYAAHNLALIYYQSLTLKDLVLALAYADKSLELGNEKSRELYQMILRDLQSPGTALKTATVKTAGSYGTEWLKLQPANRYVIQLARLHSDKAGQQFLSEHRVQGVARIVALNQEQTDFVVISQRDFSSEAEARQQIQNDLPPLLQKEAWVRRYSSLQ